MSKAPAPEIPKVFIMRLFRALPVDRPNTSPPMNLQARHQIDVAQRMVVI